MTAGQGINWKVHDKGCNKRHRQYSSIEERWKDLVYCEEEDTEMGFLGQVSAVSPAIKEQLF